MEPWVLVAMPSSALFAKCHDGNESHSFSQDPRSGSNCKKDGLKRANGTRGGGLKAPPNFDEALRPELAGMRDPKMLKS